MDLSIPLKSGQPLQITLEVGNRLFIVGANGSGKSALIQHFVTSNPNEKIKRITAHRRTWLNSGSIDITAQSRKSFDKNSVYYEVRSDARWKDDHAEMKLSAVLYDLVAKDNAQARSIRSTLHQIKDQGCDRIIEAAIEATKTVSLFEQLNELLALGMLTVSLENSEGEEILARHENDGERFSIAQMSDGERNAAIMAATVLTVEPGTVLLIDEPERHLHRALIEPFLSALFRQREDCTFVVSTHEIAMPIANPDVSVLMVQSCEWNGDTVKSWDVAVLEPNTELPEELKRAILGARRRILFVEGTPGSLDLPLYNALFPGLSVEPMGNCGDVQKAVSGLRNSDIHHHVEAFGLIDRDNRSESEIQNLAKKSVFALDVCSVEALYYCTDTIEAVAHRQAESLGSNTSEMTELAIQKAFDAMNQERIDKRMAARWCKRQLRNLVLSQLPSEEELIENDVTSKISVCISSPYPDELKRFDQLFSEKKWDILIARYPLRESSAFDDIAKALRFQNRRDYERVVITLIGKDNDLASKLKKRIRALSGALEIAPMMSEKAGS